jgi:hypothetical protein
VVERVIGNDEVLSSILSGGTMKINELGENVRDGQEASKHIVSAAAYFRPFQARYIFCLWVLFDEVLLSRAAGLRWLLTHSLRANDGAR